ncbi:MAG: DUF975 family protein [Bacteroidales bacterium]|nr:DUF975 family protein [Bacteroidales bacterium]
MTNQDYKNAALTALKGKWAPAVLAAVVMILIMMPYLAVAEYPVLAGIDVATTAPSWFLPSMGCSLLYMLLFMVPIAYIGFPNACKALLLTGDDRLTGNSFRLGLRPWLRHCWAYLLMEIKVMLWTFLFIIPGIIKSFSYALTPYLLRDCPDLSALQCIKLSDRMMKGHKFDLFYLYLSFIGWLLLGILTLGIGLLWVMPYMQTASASFYLDVKQQYQAQLEYNNQNN